MKLKKLCTLVLAMGIAATSVMGCGSKQNDPVTDTSAGQTAQTDDARDIKDINVALITDVIGTEQFILQAYNKVKEMSEEYGFKWTSMECSDTAQWAENTKAASNEGYDLIIGIGWQAAEPFGEAAADHPEIKYAVIDGVSSNDDVMSISFNEAEGAYVLGAMIGTAFPDEKLFGYISSYQTQATYKYRYGFSEGVKSVIPDAEFVYNFTNSYSDTTLAYEYAVQQQAAGCRFIMGGASASSNSGIYQAALELASKGKTIYTTGLSIDQTTQENPYIIGGLLKNTGVCTEKVLNDYMNDEFKGGPQELGLKENAFGVVHITTDSVEYRNSDIITDDVISVGKEIADKLISGELSVVAPVEAQK